MDELLDSLSFLMVEEKLSHWRSSNNRGKSVPSEIKQDVVSLLKEYKSSYIQRKLGLSGKTLKSWASEYSSEQFFIAVPPLEIKEKKSLIENVSLKFSRSNCGTWSLEGKLSLKDWQSAIVLLEGVR